MAKIIAVANQKGGVGKTTSCINMAASLAATKRRVLLLDMDPQGNATMGCGVDKSSLEKSISDVLLDNLSAKEAIVHQQEIGFDVLGANSELTAAEIGLLEMPERESYLKNALQPVASDYDFIFIDCPPSLNMLTLNAFVAANSVIIPMQCEYYALEGLSSLLETIEQLRVLNPELHIEGILRTMYDARNRLTLDVSEQLRNHFQDKLYETVIPRNIRLAEAPSFGLPVLMYDKKSQGAAAYLTLAGEMIRRMETSEVEELAVSE